MKCKAERQRRCCILRPQNQDNEARFVVEPFAAVPYVYPFRHPLYHAARLRALLFAKTAQKRLLWFVAVDKVTGNSLQGTAEQMETRKERWLELHDRYTGGIAGLVPFALDMPVRFTDGSDRAAREMGVFKHTRGVLRGWQL